MPTRPDRRPLAPDAGHDPEIPASPPPEAARRLQEGARLLDLHLAAVTLSGPPQPRPLRPLIVVAAGEANMLGWTGSNNGPLFEVPDVQIWDRGAGQLRPLDLNLNSYAVYGGDPDQSIIAMGTGRNSPAAGFARRLQEETGRPVILVPNCTGNRHSNYWVGTGRASPDWAALEHDLRNVFAFSGLARVDYFLWQQGETDAVAGPQPGLYQAALNRLMDQIAASPWWQPESWFIAGEPCREWADTVEVLYLLHELAAFRGQARPQTTVARSYGLTGGDDNYAMAASGADTAHFSGRGLYSLGYYGYWDALPATVAPKRSFAQLFAALPYPAPLAAAGERYDDPAFVTSTRAHLASPSRYALAPTFAKVGARWFCGATVNLSDASEQGGTHARIVWSDDRGATWQGDTVGGTGLGIRIDDGATGNAAEPSLWPAPDGSLWVFFMGSTTRDVFDGRSGVFLSVIANPLAASPVMSDPVRLTNYGWAQRPEFVNGAWWLPLSYWSLRPNFVPGLQGRHQMQLDWVNRRVTHAFAVAKILPPDARTFDEHSLVALPGGALLASWRTPAGIFRAISRDGGRSWTAPEPWKELAPSADSRHRALGDAGSSRIMVAWCNAKGRSNLTFGVTAPMESGDFHMAATKVIQPAGCSYPDIFQDGDDIFVSYDDGLPGRAETRRIHVARLSLSDVIAHGEAAQMETFTAISGA